MWALYKSHMKTFFILLPSPADVSSKMLHVAVKNSLRLKVWFNLAILTVIEVLASVRRRSNETLSLLRTSQGCERKRIGVLYSRLKFAYLIPFSALTDKKISSINIRTQWKKGERNSRPQIRIDIHQDEWWREGEATFLLIHAPAFLVYPRVWRDSHTRAGIFAIDFCSSIKHISSFLCVRNGSMSRDKAIIYVVRKEFFLPSFSLLPPSLMQLKFLYFSHSNGT